MSPFINTALRADKPKPEGYPDRIETLGEHVRARRMDNGLYITELAKLLGVDQETVINWELRERIPPVHTWPKLIDYLGYYPGPIASLPDRILGIRRCLGMSQEALARELGIDPGTLKRARLGRNGFVDVARLLNDYLSQLDYCTTTKRWLTTSSPP
ncbi:MAG: helix-turn-helix transcriptional regulator [Bacteroidota bacterium]